MKRAWYVEVIDSIPACPGRLVTGPYPTRDYAQIILTRQLQGEGLTPESVKYLSGRVTYQEGK